MPKNKEKTFKIGEKNIKNVFEKLPKKLFFEILPICLHCRLVSKLFKDTFDKKFEKINNYQQLDYLKLLMNIGFVINLARYDGFFLKILYTQQFVKAINYLEIINLRTNYIKKNVVLNGYEFKDLNIGFYSIIEANAQKISHDLSINITNKLILNKTSYDLYYDKENSMIDLFKDKNIIKTIKIDDNLVFKKFYLFKSNSKILYIDLLENKNSKKIIEYEIDKVFPYCSYKGKILNILLTDIQKNIYYISFYCK